MSTSIKKQNVALARQTKPTRSRPEKDPVGDVETKPGPGGVILGRTTRTRQVVVRGDGVVKAASSSSSSSVIVAKKRVPNSPTSNRVTKSQYFPNKSLYSNALNANGVAPRIKPAITDPKTSKPPTKPSKAMSTTPKSKSTTPKGATPKLAKPSLAAVKKEMREKLKKSTTVKSPDSSQEDRPRTATLKRPSIVTANIAGPEAKKLVTITKNLREDDVHETSSIAESLSTKEVDPEIEVQTEMTSTTNDNDYEDDFDSYASDDFEEYESESSPLDVSTEGEVTSSETEADYFPEETPPKRVNSAEEERKLDSGNFDLPDEPKRVQVLDQIAETKETEPVNLSSLSDEGFEEAKSSLQFVNFNEARKKRQLDKRNQRMNRRGTELMGMIRLDQQNFTLFDLPAKSYDDFIRSFGNRNSSQVASQTGEDRVEEYVQTEVITFSNKWTQFPIDKITKSQDLRQFREELLGVGSDVVDANDNWVLKDQNIPEYNEYNLKRFLQTQEKLLGELLSENQQGKATREMTTGKFPFSQGYLILNTEKYAATNLVAFSTSSKNPKIVSVHETQDLKTAGFVWSLIKPNVPEDHFTAFGKVSDITFGLDNDKLIFGGFTNGSLAVWDLLEDVNSDSRPPSFLTAIDLDLVESIVRVICFQTLKATDFQIVTLDEIGTIIIWGLIVRPTKTLGSNRISLVKNNTIHLRQQHPELNLQCTDLCLNVCDPNHLYISTNYGLILHSLVSGARTNPKRYNPGIVGAINVLEACPHSPNYFLAGGATGEVVLVAKQFEKPLMTISNQQSGAEIVAIQWSHNRPCIFYTQDTKDNIHVWDFSVSELFPIVSIHLKEQIRKFKISPRQSEISYMAIVTGDGKIHLHLLNQEHGLQELEVYNGDLQKFTRYVQRL